MQRAKISGNLKSVLPKGQTGTDVIRLMIACHVVDTLHRQMDLTQEKDVQSKPGNEFCKDSYFTLMLLAASALKEGLDSFKELSHWFKQIEKDANPKSPLKLPVKKWSGLDLIARDKENVDRKIINRFRNDAGFHWSSSRVSDALDKLSDSEGPIVEVLSEGDKHPMRFVGAQVVHAVAAFGTANPDQWHHDIVTLRRVMELFYTVTSHYFAEFFAQAGCELVEDDGPFYPV